MVWILALINWTGMSMSTLNFNSGVGSQINGISPQNVQIQYQTLDVTCMAPNCWQSGWTISDQNLQHIGSAYCVNSSCEESGWNFMWANGVQSHVVCKNNGCFRDGWIEKDIWGQVMSSTACFAFDDNGADCMRWGWETYLANGISLSTSCISEDCNHNGWDTTASNGQRERVLCKEHGCMEQGWTISQ